MIDVVCKSCGDFYQVDSKEAGFRVPCPGCRTPNRVPGGEAKPNPAGAAPDPAPTAAPPPKPRRPYLTHRSPLGIFLFAVFALSILACVGNFIGSALHGPSQDLFGLEHAIDFQTSSLIAAISGSAIMIGRRLDEMG